ncbi:hypothetical protein CALVIDRAFT_567782 [Calocera viscosa TUFC12733]|uniref:DUF6532 domain-containing protein n=1 Tax=Calocera viscosa (strain TUFC12733) TaxID=1330018 RepID=A0A167HQZ6_CALVF|nr:hypothetical protein CALVIDRAFT_567782 [Calocera viscosa TUFC12733]
MPVENYNLLTETSEGRANTKRSNVAKLDALGNRTARKKAVNSKRLPPQDASESEDEWKERGDDDQRSEQDVEDESMDNNAPRGAESETEDNYLGYYMDSQAPGRTAGRERHTPRNRTHARVLTKFMGGRQTPLQRRFTARTVINASSSQDRGITAEEDNSDDVEETQDWDHQGDGGMSDSGGEGEESEGVHEMHEHDARSKVKTRDKAPRLGQRRYDPLEDIDEAGGGGEDSEEPQGGRLSGRHKRTTGPQNGKLTGRPHKRARVDTGVARQALTAAGPEDSYMIPGARGDRFGAYTPRMKMTILAASCMYRVLHVVPCSGFWPGPVKREENMDTAVTYANRWAQQNDKPIIEGDRAKGIKTVIHQSLLSARSTLKRKAEEAVNAHFIIPHGTDKKRIAQAVQWLLGTEERPNYRFIYRNVEVFNEEKELVGMFLHEAIIFVAGNCFYHNKTRPSGDASALPKFFNPFPSEGIMAICTALFHALTEWRSVQIVGCDMIVESEEEAQYRLLAAYWLSYCIFPKDLLPYVWSTIWLKKTGAPSAVVPSVDVVRHITGVSTPGKDEKTTPMKKVLALHRRGALHRYMPTHVQNWLRTAAEHQMAWEVEMAEDGNEVSDVRNCAEALMFIWITRTLHKENHRGDF